MLTCGRDPIKCGGDGDRFDPYIDNGGTCIAIAGADFVLIGSDTRASDGSYGIISRNMPKTYRISPRIIMAAAGMKADADFLVKKLKVEAENYTAKTGREMSVESFSRLVSVSLYRRRFFPWYTFNIVGGVDERGAGRIFSYDAVGSSGEYQYTATGSGEQLAIAVLDNELMPLVTAGTVGGLTVERAKRLAERAMEAVAERDIKTGDDFLYYVVTAAGVEECRHGLRRD